MEGAALSGFHHQRDVLHHDVTRTGAVHDGGRGLADERVDDGVQDFALSRFPEHDGTQLRPVEPAVVIQDARTEGFNNLFQPRCPGFHYLPGDNIRVYEQCPQLPEPGCHQRFA